MTDSQRQTLADEVAQGIISMIVDSDLDEGTALPAEADLAARFNVNRLVVRESIRTLSAYEIVRTQQGKQAVVAVPSAAVIARLISFRIKQRSLNSEDVLSTRALIEVYSARLASRTKVSDLNVELCESILLEQEAAQGDLTAFVDLDSAFHAALVAITGNELLSLLHSSLDEVARSTRQLSASARDRRGLTQDRALREHRSILDAIVGGDPERAAHALEEHIKSTAEDLGVEFDGRP